MITQSNFCWTNIINLNLQNWNPSNVLRSFHGGQYPGQSVDIWDIGMIENIL